MHFLLILKIVRINILILYVKINRQKKLVLYYKTSFVTIIKNRKGFLIKETSVFSLSYSLSFTASLTSSLCPLSIYERDHWRERKNIARKQEQQEAAASHEKHHQVLHLLHSSMWSFGRDSSRTL